MELGAVMNPISDEKLAERLQRVELMLRKMTFHASADTVAQATVLPCDGPYNCKACLAGTWNDDDLCDDCREEARDELRRLALGDRP